MDYFVRISEQQSNLLSNEYSNKYETYNCISSVLDSIESQNGGLYPTEVWSEVLRLEKLLLTASRRDKFIAEQRTRLENKYRKIIIKRDWTSIERTKKDAERSVMCVLLALAMHLEACPDDQPNPHELIIKRIIKMVLEYDPELTVSIAQAYNKGEDEEEVAGYFVLPHDPLERQEPNPLPTDLQKIIEPLNLVIDFYSSILVNTKECINPQYTDEEFFDIWDDLMKEESIVRELSKPCRKLAPTTLKAELQQVENANQNTYNLKLVLNIIGLLRTDIVTFSIEQVNGLFFTDTKSKYLKPNEITKFGTSDSGIPDETMFRLIKEIIERHRKKHQ